jgi:tetratricopeptide (TPR) repeat protein
LAGLGQLYFRLGQYDQALDYCQQALQISRQTGEKLSEASSLSFLGGIYWRQQQLDLALEYLQSSLRLTQDMGDIINESRVLVAMGRIYQAQGNPDQAVTVLRQALTSQREVGVRPDEGSTLTVLGLAYGSQGNLPEATATLQQAIIIHQETGNLAAEAETLANLGKVLAETQPELAIVFYKQSVNVREEIRGGLRAIPQDLQQAYTASVAEDYRTLADLLLQQNRVLEAQRVLDLLKVQELEDYLHNVRGTEQTTTGVDYWELEQHILDLYNQTIAEGAELAQLQAKVSLTPTENQRRDELLARQDELRSVFQDFRERDDVRAAIAQMRTSTDGQNIELGNFNKLQNSLADLDTNAVLLYPLILPDRLELVLITPNGAPIRRPVPVSAADLNRAIVELGQALKDPQLDAQAPAQRLYEWLIAPLENDLVAAHAKTIIYAPDGALRYIPLAALP